MKQDDKKFYEEPQVRTQVLTDTPLLESSLVIPDDPIYEAKEANIESDWED